MNQARDTGGTPLLRVYAATVVVSMLLAKEGVDVNQGTDGGYTPLFIASKWATVRWCQCCGGCRCEPGQ